MLHAFSLAGLAQIPMKKTLLFTTLALLGAAAVGCDLQKTSSQLQARKVMVATLLSTPEISLDPVAALSLDGGFDAGFPLDAGLDAGLSLDGGTLTLAPQTVVFLYFGTRKSDALDAPPDPITGATAYVVLPSSTSLQLNNAGSGNYTLTSMEQSQLAYQSGQTYSFKAGFEGATFVGQVADTPAKEVVKTFHPATGYVSHAANTVFSFDRPPPPGNAERNLGLVTVFPVSDSGQKGDPTWSNIPQTPLEFLSMVALPGKSCNTVGERGCGLKDTTVRVPGAAFPHAGKTYVLVLQSVKLGGPESDNLFSGSAILAGTAEAAVIRTH